MSAAISVQVIVSVFVLIPVTSDQFTVSVLVLIPVTSPHAIVSVLALICPFDVTRPVTSPHAIVSVFVFIPEIFPVPISMISVATLFFIVVISDQSIVSDFAFTASTSVLNEVEALFISERVAREPDESVPDVSVLFVKLQISDTVGAVPPPIVDDFTSRFVTTCDPTDPDVIRVEVATFHTSAAKVPNVVRLRVADAQTFTGIVAASEVEAVSTVALVLLLIVVMAAEICELVLVLTPASVVPSDDEAARIFELAVVMLVFAVASVLPNEVEAARTAAFVFALMPVDTPAIEAPSDVDAFEILVPFAVTLVLIVASVLPSDVEAVVMSVTCASEPEVRVASVRLRVA